MSETASLLVRLPNWLGDCVMSLPTLRVLRERFPDARLVVGVRKHLAAVVAASADVDEVVACPAPGVGGQIGHFCRSVGALRERRFDLGILLTNSFGTALWMWAGGVQRRIGFARDGRGVLLTDAEVVTPELAAAHQAEYYLHLAGLAGAATELQTPMLTIAPEAREEALGLRQGYGIDGAYAVMAPVSAYGAVKDWPAERFAAVARHAAREMNLPVFVTGLASERIKLEQIATDAGEGVFPVAGATGLGGFLALIAESALFVGNDSGGAHAAAASAVPTVVLFGITEPSRTRPLGRYVSILGSGGTVTPDLKSAATRRAAEAALQAISVEEVCAAAQAVADRKHAAKGAS